MISEIKDKINCMETEQECFPDEYLSSAEIQKINSMVDDKMDSIKIQKLNLSLKTKQHVLALKLPIPKLEYFPNMEVFQEDLWMDYVGPLLSSDMELTSAQLFPMQYLLTRGEKDFGAFASGNTSNVVMALCETFHWIIDGMGLHDLMVTIGSAGDKMIITVMTIEAFNSIDKDRAARIMKLCQHSMVLIARICKYEEQKMEKKMGQREELSSDDIYGFNAGMVSVKAYSNLSIMWDYAEVVIFYKKYRDNNICRYFQLIFDRFQKLYKFIQKISSFSEVRVKLAIQRAMNPLDTMVEKINLLPIKEVIATMREIRFDYSLASKEFRKGGWNQFLALSPYARFKEYERHIAKLLLESEQTLNEMAITDSQSNIEKLVIADKEVLYEKYEDTSFTIEEMNRVSKAVLSVREWLDTSRAQITGLPSMLSKMRCEALANTFYKIVRGTQEEKILFIAGHGGSGKSTFLDALRKALPGLYPTEDQYLLDDKIGRISNISQRRLFICDESNHNNKRCVVESFSNLSRGGSTIYELSEDKRKDLSCLYVLTTARHNIVNFASLVKNHDKNCEKRGKEVTKDLVEQIERRIEVISFHKNKLFDPRWPALVEYHYETWDAIKRLKEAIMTLREFDLLLHPAFDWAADERKASFMGDYIMLRFIHACLDDAIIAYEENNEFNQALGEEEKKIRCNIFSKELAAQAEVDMSLSYMENTTKDLKSKIERVRIENRFR